MINTSTEKQERFTALYEEHYKKVYNLCIRMGSDAETARDLTQEIFIKVYRYLDTYKGNSSLSTWLFSIATNHCIDYFRRSTILEKVFRKVLLLERKEPALRLMENAIVDKCAGMEILRNLNPKYRALLILQQYLGMSYKELAEIFKTTRTSIGVMLNRARNEAIRIAEKKGIHL